MTGTLKIERVAVIPKTGHETAEKLASKLIDLLLKSRFQACTLSPFKHAEAGMYPSPSEIVKEGVDVAVSLGGDGTILRTVRAFDSEIPVLGVNVGGRGILAEAYPEMLPELVENLKKGDIYLDRRIRIRASTSERSFPAAVNEVYVARASATATPIFTVEIGLHTRIAQKMDGVILSTPTGSTGHSLSLGGPVVSEELEVFLLTPVAPISRIPSLILPANPIEISSNRSFNLIIDGQEEFKIKADERVKLEKHSRRAVFLRFGKRSLSQFSKLLQRESWMQAAQRTEERT